MDVNLASRADGTAVEDGSRLDDIVVICGVAAIAVAVVLRHSGLPGIRGGELHAVAIPLLSGVGYVATILRREWPVVLAPAGLAVAALIGWALSPFQDVAWAFDLSAFLWIAFVWAPWPTLRTRGAVAILWTLSLAPLLMLLAGPPWGDLRWLGELVTGARVAGHFNPNSVGTTAALAIVAALALRLVRDTWPRFMVQAVALLLAGATATRSIIPAVVLAGFVWLRQAVHTPDRRPILLEVLPWGVYGLLVARTVVERLLGRADAGLEGVSSGRLSLWGEYWDIAWRAPLAGHGIGSVETLRAGALTTELDPHNAILTLLVEVGVAGATIASAGVVLVLVYRSRQLAGPFQWVLRAPVVALLPALWLVDVGIGFTLVTVPILVYAAAVPWVSQEVSVRSRDRAGRLTP